MLFNKIMTKHIFQGLEKLVETVKEVAVRGAGGGRRGGGFKAES